MLHTEIYEKLAYYFSEEYLRKCKTQLYTQFTTVLVLPISALVILLFYPRWLPLSLQHDLFIFYAKLILIGLTLLGIVMLLAASVSLTSKYKKFVEGKKPSDITTYENFVELYMMKEIQMLMLEFPFDEPERLTLKNKYFSESSLCLEYLYNDTSYTKSTETYSCVSNGESSYVYATVIKHDYIYGYLKGDIYNITLFNADIYSSTENFESYIE